MKPYYQDDFVTIYHGDCHAIFPHVEGLASVLVTDPPYGIDWNISAYNGGREHEGIANDADTVARDEILRRWFGPAVVFGSPLIPAPANTKQVLVWRKPADSGIFGAVNGYRRDWEAIYLVGDWPRLPAERSAIIELEGGMGRYLTTGHPHTKPVPLMSLLLRHTSGPVLDPFMGSGSTLRAAKDLGRPAIGVEIEERYCEIAAQRCAQDCFDFGEAA